MLDNISTKELAEVLELRIKREISILDELGHAFKLATRVEPEKRESILESMRKHALNLQPALFIVEAIAPKHADLIEALLIEDEGK